MEGTSRLAGAGHVVDVGLPLPPETPRPPRRFARHPAGDRLRPGRVHHHRRRRPSRDPSARDRWHHVTHRRRRAPTSSTSIDGRQVATLRHRLPPRGGLGLRQRHRRLLLPGAQAIVQGPGRHRSDGATLYANNLSRSSALADFAGPRSRRPIRLPVIMDGAKSATGWSGAATSGWRPPTSSTPPVPTTTSGGRSSSWAATRGPTASRHGRPPTVPLGHVPRDRVRLLGLLLDGRGGQHRHLLPLHR